MIVRKCAKETGGADVNFKVSTARNHTRAVGRNGGCCKQEDPNQVLSCFHIVERKVTAWINCHRVVYAVQLSCLGIPLLFKEGCHEAAGWLLTPHIPA